VGRTTCCYPLDTTRQRERAVEEEAVAGEKRGESVVRLEAAVEREAEGE